MHNFSKIWILFPVILRESTGEKIRAVLGTTHFCKGIVGEFKILLMFIIVYFSHCYSKLCKTFKQILTEWEKIY